MKKTNKERRELIKNRLLNDSKCKACGYSKSISALCFHHRKPKDKHTDFSISGNNLTKKSFELLKAEVKKCDIYCMNCHAELHDKEGWIHENGKSTPRYPK